MDLAELQAMADMTAKFVGLDARPRVEYVEDGKVALAWTGENRITIPKTFNRFGSVWMTYYVAHEVCHFVEGCANHGNKFLAIEKKAMDFWGVKLYRKHHRDSYPFTIRKKSYEN